jgi:polygalacturonase
VPPYAPSFFRRLSAFGAVVPLLAAAACMPSDDAPGYVYTCGNSSLPSNTLEYNTLTGCGTSDPRDQTYGIKEPSFPTDICDTLYADKDFPDEDRLDTGRIQDALVACKGKGALKLAASGSNNVFVAGHITVDSVILWVDSGVTLYASRNPDNYAGGTENCGEIGINDSAACSDFITVQGRSPGIVGGNESPNSPDGVIDGQGGEPLMGRDYSWWQASFALRSIDGSIGNPTLINVKSPSSSPTTGVLLYRITLHNSPKFHVKIAGKPFDGTCTTPGEGYMVWGVTVLTPSTWYNSQGLVLTPYFARNTDGIDPGANVSANCGVIACNTISTGDDQIAIKGGHGVTDLIIAHNRLGTGHGISIGSETYGADNHGIGVQNVHIYDLTIDADSRWTGSPGGDAADSNGIRIKSDESRGGIVDQVDYSDICIRDVSNAILVSTAYNPLFSGTSYPTFKTLKFHNIHDVTCMSLSEPVVTLEGFNVVRPAGPITLDNVIVDNIGPIAVAAEFADITLGPGYVNFVPSGPGADPKNRITEDFAPKPCSFPPLPAPQPPPGWSR